MEFNISIENHNSAKRKKYKEQLKAEYHQLIKQIYKLKKIIEGSENELDLVSVSSYDLLEIQLKSMETYKAVLQLRADLENIDLYECVEKKK